MVFTEILKGAATGAGVAFLGYAKSNTKESFDGPKFLKTVVIGAFVGGVSAFTGQTPQDVEVEIGQYALVTYVIDSAVLALWRNIVAAYNKATAKPTQ